MDKRREAHMYRSVSRFAFIVFAYSMCVYNIPNVYLCDELSTTFTLYRFSMFSGPMKERNKLVK